MNAVARLLTENLPIWSSAVQSKSSAGRGTSSKRNLYGIKKLRELILDLAVRGLLVPQDPSDEPASVLLEKIAVEKERLIKEGTIKKQKPLPPIDDEEKLFELPDGWEFIRFGEIYTIEYGDGLKHSARSGTGEFPVYGSNGIVGTHNEAYILKPCIVIGRKGSAGALNLCNSSGCWVTDVAYSLVPPSSLNLEFVFMQLKTLRLDKLGKGIKPGLSRNDSYLLALALPPLAEQHRIVAKVDELMALCDKLEQEQETSIQTHENLVETLLEALTNATDSNAFQSAWQCVSAHFDTLFTTQHSIKKLKETILQLAVMGKLVPQDPSDEPASVLLEKIALEKEHLIKEGTIKKQKPLPPINDEEEPFVLPDGWEFMRITESYYTISPNNKLKTSQIANEGKYPVVDQGLNFISGYTNNENLLVRIPQPVVIFGDHTKNLKLVRFDFVAGADGTKILVPVLIFPDYFYIFCLSLKLENRGYARHFKIFNNNLMSIAPLAEQHRIVAKVDELMALCDKLENALQAAQTTKTQLTDAILEKAL